MQKSLKLFICLLIGLVFILSSIAMASTNSDSEQKKRFYLFIASGGGLVWDIKICTVETVPKYIRNVPVHPDDNGDWANIVPIEDSKLSYSPLSMNLIIVRTGIGYRFGLYDLRFGGNIYYTLGWPFWPGAIKERNYTNAPGTEQRGYGAALTYYAIHKSLLQGWNAFTPGLFLRISKRISSRSSSSLFLEYSLDFYTIHLENGWDRYDDLEKWKIYKLADIKKNTIRFGFSCWNTDFFIGYVIPDSKLTPLGETTNLKTNPYFTVGFAGKISWKF